MNSWYMYDSILQIYESGIRNCSVCVRLMVSICKCETEKLPSVTRPCLKTVFFLHSEDDLLRLLKMSLGHQRLFSLRLPHSDNHAIAV